MVLRGGLVRSTQSEAGGRLSYTSDLASHKIDPSREKRFSICNHLFWKLIIAYRLAGAPVHSLTMNAMLSQILILQATGVMLIAP